MEDSSLTVEELSAAAVRASELRALRSDNELLKQCLAAANAHLTYERRLRDGEITALSA